MIWFQEIAGIDADQLLSDKPEARVTQMQTLADIARDVEADEVYQSIVHNTFAPHVRMQLQIQYN